MADSRIALQLLLVLVAAPDLRAQEIELGTGTDSAGARACALEGQKSLEVRAELRTVTGTTDAVSATRMLSPSE